MEATGKIIGGLSAVGIVWISYRILYLTNRENDPMDKNLKKQNLLLAAAMLIAAMIIVIAATAGFGQELTTTSSYSYENEDDYICLPCIIALGQESQKVYQKSLPLASTSGCSQPARSGNLQLGSAVVCPWCGQSDCVNARPQFSTAKAGSLVCPDCGRADCWRVTGAQPMTAKELKAYRKEVERYNREVRRQQRREEISAGAAIGIAGILVKLMFGGCCSD